MALTGVLSIAKSAFAELRASNISFYEILPSRSPPILPADSQLRTTGADSDNTFDDTFRSDRFQEIRFLEEKLELFLEELKSFIHGRQFDSAAFHLQADSLYSRLTNIRDLAEVSLSPLQGRPFFQNTLFPQIRYVTSVFYLLVDSSEILDFYLAIDGPAQKLVARLILLNLRLMRLFDSRGQPISSRHNYANKVAHLATRRKELEEMFGRLKVSENIRRVFDFHIKRADASLGTLAQMIPHFEI